MEQIGDIIFGIGLSDWFDDLVREKLFRSEQSLFQAMSAYNL